jgi:cation:H+ antiporter
MLIIFWFIVLFAALAALLLAVDYFIESGERLAHHWGWPDNVKSIVVVSLATILPELMIGILAAVTGQTALITAVVAGSMLANIYLIVGLTAVVAGTVVVVKHWWHVDVPLLFACLALFIVVVWDQTVTAGEGMVLLLAALVYLFYWSRIIGHSYQDRQSEIPAHRGHRHHLRIKIIPEQHWIIILSNIFSIVILFLASFWVVKSSSYLAALLHWDLAAFGLIVLGIAVALPEVVLAFQATRSKKFELALGNVIGASLFNVLLVLAIPSFFGSFQVPAVIFSSALPFLVAGIFWYAFTTIKHKIFRLEGIFFLLIFIAFILKTIGAY